MFTWQLSVDKMLAFVWFWTRHALHNPASPSDSEKPRSRWELLNNTHFWVFCPAFFHLFQMPDSRGTVSVLSPSQGHFGWVVSTSAGPTAGDRVLMPREIRTLLTGKKRKGQKRAAPSHRCWRLQSWCEHVSTCGKLKTNPSSVDIIFRPSENHRLWYGFIDITSDYMCRRAESKWGKIRTILKLHPVATRVHLSREANNHHHHHHHDWCYYYNASPLDKHSLSCCSLLVVSTRPSSLEVCCSNVMYIRFMTLWPQKEANSLFLQPE